MARVLIVGATSAIAAATARLFAARGDSLYLLARNEQAVARLAEELGDAVAGYGTGDFAEVDAAEARIEEACRQLGGLDVALVAHGDLGDQLLSEADWAEAKRQLVVNLDSVVALLIPIANRLEAQGSGHIAVMSSVAAERGRPRNFTYAAAKSGVNTYLQGLRSRLWSAHVKVHILKLGPTDTPMTTDHEKNALFAQPDVIARGIVRAIDRGRSEVYLPWYWAPIMLVVRQLPEALFQRLSFLSAR